MINSTLTGTTVYKWSLSKPKIISYGESLKLMTEIKTRNRKNELIVPKPMSNYDTDNFAKVETDDLISLI